MSDYELDRAEMLEEMIDSSAVFLHDENERISFWVNCNDLWSWASADGEEIPYGEIENCYKLGAITWACVRRNLRPFDRCEEEMKKRDAWNDTLDALPLRGAP